MAAAGTPTRRNASHTSHRARSEVHSPSRLSTSSRRWARPVTVARRGSSIHGAATTACSADQSASWRQAIATHASSPAAGKTRGRLPP